MINWLMGVAAQHPVITVVVVCLAVVMLLALRSDKIEHDERKNARANNTKYFNAKKQVERDNKKENSDFFGYVILLFLAYFLIAAFVKWSR